MTNPENRTGDKTNAPLVILIAVLLIAVAIQLVYTFQVSDRVNELSDLMKLTQGKPIVKTEQPGETTATGDAAAPLELREESDRYVIELEPAEPVAPEAVEANYENGVLTVSIPKSD